MHKKGGTRKMNGGKRGGKSKKMMKKRTTKKMRGGEENIKKLICVNEVDNSIKLINESEICPENFVPFTDEHTKNQSIMDNLKSMSGGKQKGRKQKGGGLKLCSGENGFYEATLFCNPGDKAYYG